LKVTSDLILPKSVSLYAQPLEAKSSSADMRMNFFIPIDYTGSFLHRKQKLRGGTCLTE